MSLNTLSGRFALLTGIFVLLAELLILLPSISNYRLDFLESRLERAQIGADAETARGAVRLIERPHPFEYRDMVAQSHVDLCRDLRGLVGLAGLVVKETGGGGSDRRKQDDQPDETDQQRQQPISP